MPPKPVCILLKQRLAACLMEGTSIIESGLKVSTDKLPGEIILFFRVDSDAGRVCLDMVDLRTCDCLIFYTKENESEEMLCFLELKGNGLDEAAKQIISTHLKMKQLLATNHIQNITLIACVCMRHQAPPGYLRHAERLKRIFGSNVHLKFGVRHYKELGLLFRSRIT